MKKVWLVVVVVMGFFFFSKLTTVAFAQEKDFTTVFSEIKLNLEQYLNRLQEYNNATNLFDSSQDEIDRLKEERRKLIGYPSINDKYYKIEKVKILK